MADQEIINYGSEPNDGTGDPLRDAFIKVDNNFGAIWNAGPVGSNITINNNTIEALDTNGNIVIKPNGVGVIQTRNNIVPSGNNIYSLGAPNFVFRSAYIGTGGITVAGNLNVANIVSNTFIANSFFGNSLSISDGANAWTMSGDTLFAPSGAFWRSDVATKDEYINSATDGYINITTFDSSNDEASQIQIEHGLIQFNFYNGINTSWSFNGLDSTTSIPGNLLTPGNVIAANFIGNIAGNISVGGTNTGVLFNDSGTADAVSGFTYDKSSNLVTVLGNISAENVQVSGNLVGNGAQISSVLADRGNDTNNWDVLTTMGVYKVNRTSWSGTVGTPLDSQIFVGLLQVLTATDATTQIFLPGSVEPGDQKIQWNRSRWDGIWTSWIKIVNNGQIIDAGSY